MSKPSTFVDAYNTSTGVKQTIPRRWLDHPVLGVGFSLTPQATVAELKAEIARRNAGRDDDTAIRPASDLKADLAAAIQADDNPPA